MQKVKEIRLTGDEAKDAYNDPMRFNNSGLSLFAKSPKQYHLEVVSKKAERPWKSYFAFGSMYHELVLEGIDPMSNHEYTLLNSADQSRLYKMANVLKDYSYVQMFSSEAAKTEEMFFAVIDDTVFIKGKIDCLIPPNKQMSWDSNWHIDQNTTVNIDLKTTKAPDKETWLREAFFNYGYDCQAGWYEALCQAAYPNYEATTIYVVQQKKRPYNVWEYRVPKALSQAGFRKNLERSKALKYSYEQNYWPETYGEVIWNLKQTQKNMHLWKKI